MSLPFWSPYGVFFLVCGTKYFYMSIIRMWFILCMVGQGVRRFLCGQDAGCSKLRWVLEQEDRNVAALEHAHGKTKDVCSMTPIYLPCFGSYFILVVGSTEQRKQCSASSV